jgi:hypothetical protein
MMMMDIRKYYLGTPLPRFEYMKMLLSRFPEEIIQKYNLNALGDRYGRKFKRFASRFTKQDRNQCGMEAFSIKGKNESDTKENFRRSESGILHVRCQFRRKIQIRRHGNCGIGKLES